jgi:acyl-CoA synthetase (NDP forming)
LCDQPLPAGGRVAVVSNSGGTGILAADAADGAGLIVENLTTDTERRLRVLAPAAPSCTNPVDLGAEIDPTDIGDAVRVLLAAPEIDAVLAVFSDTTVADADWAMRQIAAAAGISDKPVIAARVGASSFSIPINGTARALPVFTFPEPAVTALAAAVRYARMRASRTPEVVRPDGIDQIGALEIVNREVAMGISWMGADDVALLLSCYGIAVAAQRVAGDLDAAIRAGNHLGYPLAVSLDPGELHPQDFGVVRITATDESTLRTAFTEILSLLPDSPGVLLQPTPPPGMEMIVGAVQHDRFGPAVMVGAGGILANLIADRMFRLTPLSADAADAMLRELRTAPVLDGYLGTQAARAAMCDLMVRVGALADDVPQVAEIELDPVICGGDGTYVVDARIRVSPADPRPDPLLRQLM